MGKLQNGHYRTAAGSQMWISGDHGGKSVVEFDWLEESACPDCKAQPYEFDGMLVWHCDECEGGCAPLYPADPTACAWKRDEDGNWHTACGGMFVIEEGTPADNSMAFCCYCGKPLAGPNVEVTGAARLYRAASVWTAGLASICKHLLKDSNIFSATGIVKRTYMHKAEALKKAAARVVVSADSALKKACVLGSGCTFSFAKKSFCVPLAFVCFSNSEM